MLVKPGMLSPPPPPPPPPPPLPIFIMYKTLMLYLGRTNTHTCMYMCTCTHKHTDIPVPRQKDAHLHNTLSHWHTHTHQGKNYTGLRAISPPKCKKESSKKTHKKAPENCHRLQCKSLFNVADLVNGMWKVAPENKNLHFWPHTRTHTQTQPQTIQTWLRYDELVHKM